MLLRGTVFFLFCFIFSIELLWGQCNALSSNRSIDFSTNRMCAPVTVDTFKITYNFLAPQNPADITILYEWNDPANTITVVDAGSGLIANGTNTAFTADATFTYTDNNGQCTIRPTVSIFINGVQCFSSIQEQTAPFWARDDQANGVVDLRPSFWDVCFNQPVLSATFEDDSEFNCNINVEPDNPNRLTRHVQFVYGTNHTPAATIRNLTLTDGGVVPLTDGTGNLVSTTTKGTPGLLVTGAYFGPIDAIPFPADGPISVSFPMNAPADPANLINNRFRVTMYNWNVCNPWNGDVNNPNYEDAVATIGVIRIVETPVPDFETRDASNVLSVDFCINEVITFNNLTPNPNNRNFQYTWEFYDDAAGTNLLFSTNAPGAQTTTTFSYSTGGTKLIRLLATNATAQTPCIEVAQQTVNITPALVAQISTTDLSNVPITPDFCQEGAPPLTNFDVRFHDVSTGTVTANTRWRWEFYNESNVLVFQSPGGGAFSATQLGPSDRVFTNPGVYRAVLITRDNITSCESRDEVQVRVFRKPVPDFTFTRECTGDAIAFTDASTLVPIAGEQIITREWDLDYDGVTFVSDPALLNQTSFSHTFPAAGTYRVALRVTTNANSCSAIVEHNVIVDPLPLASFTANPLSGCSVLPVTLTNTAIAGQPDVIDQYIWEVDAGSGFQTDFVQDPSAPGFSIQYQRDFTNTGTVNKTYLVRLRVVTVNGCESISPSQLITVNPGPTSGFVSLNYSPFNDNCSPVSVDFVVDAVTQSMNPTSYVWTISDVGGVVDQINTGTTPNITYAFVNSTQAIRDFQINLETTLATGCSNDSTLTVRINPVPVSAFTITEVANDCESVTLNFNAQQKGLAVYDWQVSINGVLVFVSDLESFDYVVNRSTVVDQNISARLITTNFANCVSGPTVNTYDVLLSNVLVADFTATPPSQTIPNSTITITNQSTPGPWQYLWDLGDGTTSANPALATHTYALPGTYTITLSISDGVCTDTDQAVVVINPAPPILDFDYDPASGCSPLTVEFTNLSQFADPSTFIWDFGPTQGTSQEVNPVHTYFDPGVYSVTLSASDNNGGRISVTKTNIIQVFESPTARFAVYPPVVQIPNDLLYLDNRSENASSFIWNFGDGGTSTEYEPQYKYKTEGTFDIELIASNANGCTDTARVESAVQAIESGQLLIPNAFRPNLSGPGSTNLIGNEVFLPLMRRVSKFNMLIFNRWGELLFESTNPDAGWDGYYKGGVCPQDVYIYKITVEYDDGKQVTKTGDVTLIR